MIYCLAGRGQAEPDPSHRILLRLDWVPQVWEQIIQDLGLGPIVPFAGGRPSVADDATTRDPAMINTHAYQGPPELVECIRNT